MSGRKRMARGDFDSLLIILSVVGVLLLISSI